MEEEEDEEEKKKNAKKWTPKVPRPTGKPRSSIGSRWIPPMLAFADGDTNC